MLIENNYHDSSRGPVPKHSFLMSLEKKDLTFAILLFLLTGAVTVAYYVNHPAPEVYPDSLQYLALARHIEATGQALDPHRLPGFPLMIALDFKLFGQDNLIAVQITNIILFVWSVMELYIISLLLFKNAVIAFLVGALIGTNVVMLSFMKPIASEALALWFLVTMTLASLRFLQTFRKRYLWLAGCYMLGLFFTRAEWIYLPIPFMLFLVFYAIRRKQPLRPIILHALAVCAMLYAALGSYIYANYVENQVASITDIQSINELGKVLQYNMQDDAPPKYASLTHIVDAFHARGGLNPYDLLAQHPELAQNHYTNLGSYCQAIILHDLPQFMIKTVILTVHTIPDYYLESKVNPHGFMGLPLTLLQDAYHLLYKLNILYLLSALPWLVLAFRKRTAPLYMVQGSTLLILIAACGIFFSTLGGYDSYPRFHAPLNPLLIIAIWGSLFLALRYLSTSAGRQEASAFFRRGSKQPALPHSQAGMQQTTALLFPPQGGVLQPSSQALFSPQSGMLQPSSQALFPPQSGVLQPSSQPFFPSQSGIQQPSSQFRFPSQSGIRRQFHFPSQSGIQRPATVPLFPSQEGMQQGNS